MGNRKEERQTEETKCFFLLPHLDTRWALVRLQPWAETHHKFKSPSLPSLSVCCCAVPTLRSRWSSLHPSRLLPRWLLSPEMTSAPQVTPIFCRRLKTHLWKKIRHVTHDHMYCNIHFSFMLQVEEHFFQNYLFISFFSLMMVKRWINVKMFIFDNRRGQNPDALWILQSWSWSKILLKGPPDPHSHTWHPRGSRAILWHCLPGQSRNK